MSKSGADRVALYYGDATPALIHLAKDSSGKKPAFGLTDAEIEKAYADAKPGTLNPTVYNHTRDVLHKAVDRVYGNPKYNDPEFDKAYQLKENLSRFTAFKTAEQSDLLSAAGDMDEAHIINRRYNVNYLRTEYVHAVRGSRAAKNWERIQADKDLYPNLKYMPSTAAEPRNDHKRLYGMVRPVDDDFWREWFPPNDWGCLCSTEQVRGKPKSSAMPKGMKAPPPVMRNNPGISGKLIPDSHPMIKRIKNKEKVEKQGAALEHSISRGYVMGKAQKGIIGNKYEDSTGMEVLISDTGVEKILSQGSAYDLSRNEMVLQIPEILKNMHYVKDGYIAPKHQRNIRRVLLYDAQSAHGTMRITIFELQDSKRVLHGMYIKK